MLFLDLDRFKVVNDSLGHSAGDRLLVAVADRLSGAMGPTDIVARFGGDEFTVLCQNVTSEETAELMAERIAQAIAVPVALVEGEVFVTASIGITLSGSDTDTPETLLRNADAAMYQAKELGRDRRTCSKREPTVAPSTTCAPATRSTAPSSAASYASTTSR